MKKFFAIALSLLLVLSLCACGETSGSAAAETPPHSSSNVINVYNWGQYISDGTDDTIDVNKAFEEATGITVNYITFDSNETLYSKLVTGGVNIDVVIPSDYMIARLIEENLIQKINFDNVPNYQYIDEQYKNLAHDPNNEYSVPYTWGTVGLIYNTKYVDKEVDSWSLLWDEDYAGKILMFDNPRDAFAIAQFMLGYSVNPTDIEELEAAKELLAKQTPILQGYVMDQIYDLLEDEEAWIAPYYAGDYLMMAEENEDLEFCFPKEGFNIFVDAACIPTCAQNKEGAEAYINFLCDPQVCGENLDAIGYSTPNSTAKEFMDEETAYDPIAYPDAEILARSESFGHLPAEINQVMDSLWLDVKTSSSANTQLIFAVSFIAVIILAVVVFKVRKSLILRHRRQRREQRAK